MAWGDSVVFNVPVGDPRKDESVPSTCSTASVDARDERKDGAKLSGVLEVVFAGVLAVEPVVGAIAFESERGLVPGLVRGSFLGKACARGGGGMSELV